MRENESLTKRGKGRAGRKEEDIRLSISAVGVGGQWVAIEVRLLPLSIARVRTASFGSRVQSTSSSSDW